MLVNIKKKYKKTNNQTTPKQFIHFRWYSETTQCFYISFSNHGLFSKQISMLSDTGIILSEN